MADIFTKTLKDKGYTGIAFPNREFRLLTLVYEWRGRRSHENAIEQLAPGLALKFLEPEKHQDVPNISGVVTRSFDLNVGISILSGLIGALGGGTLGIGAGFKNTKKITFSYGGIETETLNAIVLQQALNQYPAPASGMLADWMADQMYVITSIVSATKIKVTAHGESGVNPNIDVPTIAGAVGGKAKIDIGKVNDSEIEFEGALALPIGAKLFQVQARKSGASRILDLKAAKAGSVEIKLVDDDEGAGEPEPIVLDMDYGALDVN